MNHASRDFKNMFSLAYGANPTTQTDNTAITATITKGGEEMVAFIFGLGGLADADTALTLAIEDSDDNATYAACSTSDYSGTLTGIDFADDNTIHVFSYWGKKKYVKLTATPANNTGNLTSFIIKVAGNGRVQP